MHRASFLALGASAALFPAAGRAAQSEFDPAMTAPQPSLRVLLGPGDAQAVPSGGFLFQGRPYRGTFSRTAGGAIVNVVGVEQYLYSVVPHEMPPTWPGAALAAQAICARTYVLQRSNPSREYDLVPSEADQVYSGVTTETPSGIAAVEGTAGQVLRYQGAFARVAYSSCCGGHTESAAEAWGGVPVAYLGGVVCPYCTQSPNYRWSATVALDALAATFASELGPSGALQSVQILDRDASGRARSVALLAQRGSATIKGAAFRASAGPRVVRSLLITGVRTAGPSLVLEGGGLGHGVGMCQWGSRGMALAGRSARDILALYFPGTEIGND
ncbi:MAG: SpoIID/LytB domain-containing protein [Candidatus Eremiobacteraeota bacterium]|nr:SpoIID/LytB domain-containing protein [Candidatus Eremiobacteraeota bacterium]